MIATICRGLREVRCWSRGKRSPLPYHNTDHNTPLVFAILPTRPLVFPFHGHPPTSSALPHRSPGLVAEALGGTHDLHYPLQASLGAVATIYLPSPHPCSWSSQPGLYRQASLLRRGRACRPDTRCIYGALPGPPPVASVSISQHAAHTLHARPQGQSRQTTLPSCLCSFICVSLACRRRSRRQ